MRGQAGTGPIYYGRGSGNGMRRASRHACRATTAEMVSFSARRPAPVASTMVTMTKPGTVRNSVHTRIVRTHVNPVRIANQGVQLSLQ